jgi:hypothetical protein
MPPVTSVKKERGCFQCSRRRIVCDRTEPSCRKCAKKNIECSGLGRIRFAEGVARRGRFKGCKVPKAGGDDGCEELPTTTEFQSLRWPGEERAEKRRKKSDLDQSAEELPAPATITPAEIQSDQKDASSPAPSETYEDLEAEVEDIGRGHDSIVADDSQPYEIAPWVAPIDPKLRMLFSYCTLPSSVDRSLTVYS